MANDWQSWRARLAKLGATIDASTDPAVLSILRFLGFIYGPIDRNLTVSEAYRKALKNRVSAHATWWHALGGIAYFLLMALVFTGLMLAVYYHPSAQEAYPSIQHIISEVTVGWLMRDAHAWAANLVVLLVLAHMARVTFTASYRPPRETSWLIGLGLLFIVLAFGATGTLLPWDQGAYWTVTDALDVVAAIPVVGGLFAGLLRGDTVVSGATLSRFFALHVIVLPWLALALLVFHFAIIRRHGIAPAPTTRPGAEGRPFFPNHLLRSFMVVAATTAILITLAAVFPRTVDQPADPSRPPATLQTTWVVADVSRALTHYLGAFGFIVFLLLGIGLALVPLFDRGTERSLRRRPIVTTLGVLFFGGFFILWIAGTRLHHVTIQRPPAAQQVSRPAR